MWDWFPSIACAWMRCVKHIITARTGPCVRRWWNEPKLLKYEFSSRTYSRLFPVGSILLTGSAGGSSLFRILMYVSTGIIQHLPWFSIYFYSNFVHVQSFRIFLGATSYYHNTFLDIHFLSLCEILILYVHSLNIVNKQVFYADQQWESNKLPATSQHYSYHPVPSSFLRIE